jgi:hypothetical protein
MPDRRRRNGSVVFRGTCRTVAPSGSFEVQRILAGGGRIVATARVLATGETCRAALSIELGYHRRCPVALGGELAVP